MSRSRFLRTIRRQDFYKPMLRALAQAGVSEFEILPPTGLGHPILTFENGLTKVRIPLPSTPSGGSTTYVPRAIRQSMRKAKAALSEKTK